MSNNVKNYMEHGGEKMIIGGEIFITGKITIDDDAETEGFPTYTLPTASADTKGGVKVGSGLSVTGEVLSVNSAANQAASEAATVAALKDDLNALLTKLKTAGLMTADTPVQSDDEDDEGGDE